MMNEREAGNAAARDDTDQMEALPCRPREVILRVGEETGSLWEGKRGIRESWRLGNP